MTPARYAYPSAALAALILSLAATRTLAQTPRYDPKAELQEVEIAPGPFESTYESFARGYKCPRWFRDAKLGIWAHWGPQSVPMDGDWYARNMYIQGSGQYEDHLKNYGHPSKNGWKDVVKLWKAEKWDPNRLMALYKKAGARYFVSMGVHHDNFDDWNSKYNPWNAVMVGPHRDVVGDWRRAAKKLGLKFGVSEHLGASLTWFQVAHGSDKTGPLAGVPYDGADPANWSLYHFPALPGDTGWYSNDPRWHKEWFNRIKDLVDTYEPDLLYTDGGVAFGNEVGRSIIAHLYNTSAERNGGRVEAVYTCKQPSKGMWVEDLERGVMAGIRPEPWQTDTSIGDWYYNRNWKYRGADWVIQMLVDIVSKNGNLLINVVQRPDGSLDPEAEQVLADMAKWIGINGEAIYGSRPWLVYGEGPVRARGGSFGEDYKYTARDVRFLSKGDGALYVAVMGWPEDGRVDIRSLARFPGVTGRIATVRLLGSREPVAWSHDAEGLHIRLTGPKPCDYAIMLKVTGRNLRGFKPELAAPQIAAVQPDADGGYTLKPDDAELHGSLKVEAQGGEPNIGFWDNADDTATWKLAVKAPGRYRVVATCATVFGETPLVVDAAGKKVEGTVTTTGAWDRFADVELGVIELRKAGDAALTVRPRDAQSWHAVNLRRVRLLRI